MAEKETRLTIRDKSVFQSESYVPGSHQINKFIGREHELRLITAAWISGNYSQPMSPLLIGEPGVGKNRLIYELAQKTGRQLYILQGHEDITSEDLACTVRFSDSGNSAMDYILSPLVTAMNKGGICFIDEIGKIRPRALALLVSVLDERRYIDSTLLGERIHAHPGFRFIAATNTADVNLLPEFITSRMRPRITIGFPPKEEIDDIIRDQCSGIKKEVDMLIDLFWLLWTENGGSVGAIAPRDAIYLFGWASRLCAFESTGGMKALKESGSGNPFDLSNSNHFTGIRPEHLRQSFKKMFSERNQSIA